MELDFTSDKIGQATEYKRPNGKKVHREFDIEEGLEEKHKAIKEYDLVFTCEDLGTGAACFTLTDEDKGDFIIEVVPVPANAKEIFNDFIERFDEEKYKMWRDVK